MLVSLASKGQMEDSVTNTRFLETSMGGNINQIQTFNSRNFFISKTSSSDQNLKENRTDPEKNLKVPARTLKSPL